MLPTLVVITGTVFGVMVGVEFAVAVFINPIFRRLPVGTWIESQAAGARVVGGVMPFWYLTSLALTAALAAVASHPAAMTAAIVSAGLQVAVAVLSLAVLVPINNRAKTWTEADHPADWREQSARWDRYHYLRVALILAALVLILITAVA